MKIDLIIRNPLKQLEMNQNKPRKSHDNVSGKEGKAALERMRQHIQDLELPELTLDEINAEIADVRKERKARKAVAQ